MTDGKTIMPPQDLRSWLEGRLDRQDNLLERRVAEIGEDIKAVRLEMNSNFLRKDIADANMQTGAQLAKSLDERLKKLEDRPTARLTMVAMIAAICSCTVAVLSYLHIIPHP